eukprot:gnl/TRDRNA2_/TRDRNA2_129614_c2_seq1.p1 gnl/TRDRNA2_/TRDRNA2_129614_c2~~gnl/TRDRNA2_/TRDRNA2_129614_c2_seq1.p1  ORF type:complete len:382 (-),score=103.20 gnl/TRDRNA2_/TRDRNA2_129614_c2_seq1:74-1090(-)
MVCMLGGAAALEAGPAAASKLFPEELLLAEKEAFQRDVEGRKSLWKAGLEAEKEALRLDSQGRQNLRNVGLEAEREALRLDLESRQSLRNAGLVAEKEALKLDAESRQNLRNAGLVAEEEALRLDRQGRQMEREEPNVFKFIAAGQGAALLGAAAGGTVAFERGRALEQEKKKLEERLKVEEELLEKLNAVKSKLVEQRREGKAAEEMLEEQKVGDPDYMATRALLLRAREALDGHKVLEADQLFRKAFAAAQAAGERQADLMWKAVRGLAAASKLDGDVASAIAYMERCIHLSTSHSATGDSFGYLADLYESVGDYETAAKYYDRWLETVDVEGEYS